MGPADGSRRVAAGRCGEHVAVSVAMQWFGYYCDRQALHKSFMAIVASVSSNQKLEDGIRLHDTLAVSSPGER